MRLGCATIWPSDDERAGCLHPFAAAGRGKRDARGPTTCTPGPNCRAGAGRNSGPGRTAFLPIGLVRLHRQRARTGGLGGAGGAPSGTGRQVETDPLARGLPARARNDRGGVGASGCWASNGVRVGGRDAGAAGGAARPAWLWGFGLPLCWAPRAVFGTTGMRLAAQPGRSQADGIERGAVGGAGDSLDPGGG